jgi:acetylglutamate kinase
MQETIYIPKNQEEQWEKIKQAAQAERQGVGYVLIRSWEREQEAKKDGKK